MDSTTSYKLCPLCCCFQLEFSNNMESVEKVEKYLQIKLKTSSTGICLNCLNSLKAFHEFYERVHAAQVSFYRNIECHTEDALKKFLASTPKTEIREEPERSLPQNEINTTFSFSETLPEVPQIEENKESNQNEDLKNISLDETKIETEDSKLDQSLIKKNKSLKHSKLSMLSDVEKKMLEFYNIRCEKCEGGKFTSFKMLSKHYMTVHNTQGYIKCCKRNIRVNDKYYLRSHMFKHLEPDTCRCRVCGKELSSTATLKHHMILHKPTEERPFQCKECGKRFCCKNDLKNHEKAIHLPENEREDYICDVCGKVFQKVANLRYHHSTVHLQERKYICEVCAKCFATQSGLRTHINAVHSTLDPIQCKECKKWLKTKDTFQKHLQLHQNNAFPCTKCSKVCNSAASLRSHLVKHSEERPHSCTVCKKSFKTKTHLKNHSSQHVGGNHYKCPYCPKFFVNMSNYYTHRRRIHSNEKGNKQNYKKSINQESESQEQMLNDVYDDKLMKNSSENYDGSSFENVFPPGEDIIITRPVKFL